MIQDKLYGFVELIASYFIFWNIYDYLMLCVCCFWNPCGRSPYKEFKWNLENWDVWPWSGVSGLRIGFSGYCV